MPVSSQSIAMLCAGCTRRDWSTSSTTFTDRRHAAQQRQRSLIWWFYADLKAYRRDPDPRRRTALRARFDRIFGRRAGFATLDRLLERLRANKDELLVVLDRPKVPLNTNGSERDLPPQAFRVATAAVGPGRCACGPARGVTKRKISGGTRSDPGRECRDAFAGPAADLRQARRVRGRRPVPARPRQDALSNRLNARLFAPGTEWRYKLLVTKSLS